MHVPNGLEVKEFIRGESYCDSCEYWDVDAHQIFGSQVYAILHGFKMYDGEKFKFCPWCGAALKKYSEAIKDARP